MTSHRFERPKPLAGRGAQGTRLDRLLADARAGQSAVLVLRGEPGIGKTALLDYAAESAGGFQVARAAGVESEMELPFAGLHQLCGPMLGGLGRLPSPQRDALGTAFGVSPGAQPDRFLVGLAVLSLLSDTAEERPLLCLIDDAQWLDRSSAQVLTFVARRLQAESVVLLFAEREPGELDQLAGLPDLPLPALPDDCAREVLASAISGPLDDRAPRPLPWPCDQPASARWSGAQASRRPAQGADRQPDGTRCLEGHHASGPKRVHLLGRGCQAEDDPRTPHPPDPGGAGGRPASALLLARVQAPRAHRQIATSASAGYRTFHPAPATSATAGPGTARESRYAPSATSGSLGRRNTALDGDRDCRPLSCRSARSPTIGARQILAEAKAMWRCGPCGRSWMTGTHLDGRAKPQVPAAGRAFDCSTRVSAASNRRAIESQSVRLSANS